MTTLLLDNFIAERYSRYFSQYFQSNLKVFKASKYVFPKDIDNYDHIILSGSEESILNDIDWMDREMSLVREIIDKKIPTLGICFGHQVIVKALLGTGAVRRAHSPEIGWKKVNLETEDRIFEGINEEFYTYVAHFDEVYNLSKEIVVLASSEMCNAHAFKVKDAPVWGVQFHPEIDIDSGKKFIRDLEHEHPELEMDFDVIIRDAKDSGISERLFGNFFNSSRD